MTDHNQRQAIASLLLENVHRDEVGKVESSMSQFQEDSQWREIVRWEFRVQELMADILQYDLTLPRLMAYEINTLSPFHYAALRGLNEILINFIDHDIPVDLALTSGSTALHLAAFGGKLQCIQMLLDVYKAEINKQDRYGWSALHYACTEGQYDAVVLLVKAGISVSLRDQDGTSAAFRAQVNGYTDIVKLLCEGRLDLLQITPSQSSTNDDIYSEIWASHTSPSRKTMTMTKDQTSTKNSGNSNILRRHDSLPSSFKGEDSKPNKDHRTSTIRRLIRKELEYLDQEQSGYMDPVSLLNPDGDDEDEKLALASIGANTLKGVIREELGRYTKRLLSKSEEKLPEEDPYDLGVAPPPPAKPPVPAKPARPVRNDYEDIYETVKAIPRRKPSVEQIFKNGDELPKAPPLPPRNPSISIPEPVDEEDEQDVFVLARTSMMVVSDSIALNEAIQRIGQLVGKDWKKLAYALTLERNPNRIADRIDAIEQNNPGNVPKQATAALVEWRINQGQRADTDSLILALRKCGLNSLIGEVEEATQEFTA